MLVAGKRERTLGAPFECESGKVDLRILNHGILGHQDQARAQPAAAHPGLGGAGDGVRACSTISTGISKRRWRGFGLIAVPTALVARFKFEALCADLCTRRCDPADVSRRTGRCFKPGFSFRCVGTESEMTDTILADGIVVGLDLGKMDPSRCEKLGIGRLGVLEVLNRFEELVADLRRAALHPEDRFPESTGVKRRLVVIQPADRLKLECALVDFLSEYVDEGLAKIAAALNEIERRVIFEVNMRIGVAPLGCKASLCLQRETGQLIGIGLIRLVCFLGVVDPLDLGLPRAAGGTGTGRVFSSEAQRRGDTELQATANAAFPH